MLCKKVKTILNETVHGTYTMVGKLVVLTMYVSYMVVGKGLNNRAAKNNSIFTETFLINFYKAHLKLRFF